MKHDKDYTARFTSQVNKINRIYNHNIHALHEEQYSEEIYGKVNELKLN